MKKFLAILVVFAMVAGAVFADNPELSVSVSGKASTNLFYATNGDGAWDTGSADGKISALQSGSTDLLSYNDGPGTDGWDATIGFGLSVEGAEAGIDFVLNKESYGNYKGVNGDGDLKATIGEFLLLDGWHLSGTAGIFDAYIGTGDYKGKASAVGGYNLFQFGEDKVEGGNLNFAGNGGGLFAVGIQPLDLLKIAFGTGLGSFGTPNAFGSRSGVNAAFLVSLIDLGEVVTFDIFYGVQGGDENTIAPGTGAWKNLIGLYLDLNVVENLGIFLGYTAEINVLETTRSADGEDKITQNKPIISGIDLNVSFSGIENVGIHLNNNISLSSAAGTDQESVYNYNLAGTKPLGEDIKEDQFVYVGELGGSYAVSDELGLSLTLTEKAASYNYTDSSGDDTITNKLTKNYFEAFFKASYSIGPVTLESGLALGLDNVSFVNNSGGDDFKVDANKVTFSIPVFFKVAF